MKLKIKGVTLHKIRQYNMETTSTIRIQNPSKELVAFIEKTQQQKKERMKIICDKYRKQING